jgi:hypothetical protein
MQKKNIVRLVVFAIVGMIWAGPVRSASAQLGSEGIPDLSSIADEVGKSLSTPGKDAPKDAGGLFKTSMSVPSVKPGETARDIGRQLRVGIEKQAGPKPELAQLEEGMPKILAGVEEALGKAGFAKRDLAIAVAFAALTNWETANKQSISEEATIKAGKTIATAISKHWAPNFAKMDPAAKEKAYETLLVSTTLLSGFAQQFDKAGKTQEADGMRQTAGAMFKKLIGVDASQMKVSADGMITGLAPGKPEEAEKPAPAAD